MKQFLIEVAVIIGAVVIAMGLGIFIAALEHKFLAPIFFGG